MSAQAEASTRPKAPEVIPGATGIRTPIGLIAALVALALIGVAGFIIGVTTEIEPHAWQAFLVNFLFFLGIAQGGVMVSGAFYLTQARWGGPGAYRLEESFYVFVPVAFVLFWILFYGCAELWPWVTRPSLAKNPAWLNTPFFFAREGFALFVLTALDLLFIRISHTVAGRQSSLSK